VSTETSLKRTVVGVLLCALIPPTLHLLFRSEAIDWLWTDQFGRSFAPPLLAFWTVLLPALIGFVVLVAISVLSIRRFMIARDPKSAVAIAACALAVAMVIYITHQQLLPSTEPWWHWSQAERGSDTIFSPVQTAIARAYSNGYQLRRSSCGNATQFIPYDPTLLQRTSFARLSRAEARRRLGLTGAQPPLHSGLGESFLMSPPPECSCPRLDLRYAYDAHDDLVVVAESIDVPVTCRPPEY
jgi:hypothetical protein